jgi:hypothetical protein
MDHDMERAAMVFPRETKVKRQVHNYWAEVRCSGTTRINWTGLIMSVDWGGPEAIGGASNRRS